MTFFSFQQLVYEELFRIPGILESSSGIRRGEGIQAYLRAAAGLGGGGGGVNFASQTQLYRRADKTEFLLNL